MDEIDFDADSFEDLVEKDSRYDARAYALLMDVVHYLGMDGKHMDAEGIMDEFKKRGIEFAYPTQTLCLQKAT